MNWTELMAFIQAPPAWAAILILIGGVLLLNFCREFWAFVVLVGLAGFAWIALGTLVASIGLGWPYMLGWLLVATILLYNAGWLVERERYWHFTFNMVFAFVLGALLFANLYKLSVWQSIGAGFGVLTAHICIGVCVAVIKWWSFNKKKIQQGIDGKVRYLRDLTHQKDSFQRVLDESQPADGRQAMNRREPRFQKEAIAAIAALPGDVQHLRSLTVPDALRDDYLHYVATAGLMVPTAYESKERFLAWAVGWPAVLVHLILADLVEHLWRWIYEHVVLVLDKMQRKIFRGHEEFLKT